MEVLIVVAVVAVALWLITRGGRIQATAARSFWSGSAQAAATMQQLNPHAVHAHEGGREVFIEDVSDPDGRMYRVEYQCDAHGRKAIAYCRHNPWGNNPHSYHEAHLRGDGFLCIGPGVHDCESPYDLEYAVRRARFWCGAYSYFREHGLAETKRVLPEW